MSKGRALLIMLVLLVAACGKTVTSGTVISREHTDAYTTYSSQCYSYDAKTGACTLSMPVPHYWPDEWDLCLRDDSEDRPEKDRDTGCVEVTEAEWGRYHVGDHYPAKGGG